MPKSGQGSREGLFGASIAEGLGYPAVQRSGAAYMMDAARAHGLRGRAREEPRDFASRHIVR